MIKGHGGNIDEAARIARRPVSEITDMSSNTNPLGPMPGMLEYLQERMDRIVNLPEADSLVTISHYAGMEGLNPESILAAGGTTQFIYTIPRIVPWGRALIVGPTYADYADACLMNKVPYTWIVGTPDNGFDHDLSSVSSIARDYDLVFMCSPNNPTGTLFDPDDIRWLANKCPQTVIVVDESYLPFVPDYQGLSLASADLPNVIVLSSFSKIYKAPGLRIGFAIAHEVLKDKLENYQLPWSVGSLGQEAVAYVCKNEQAARDYVNNTAAFVIGETRKLRTAIRDVEGLKMFPGAASFSLFRLPEGVTASTVWEGMLKHGFLIRDCTNFHGLGEQYVRLSLKDIQANERAARAFVQVVSEAVGEGQA